MLRLSTFLFYALTFLGFHMAYASDFCAKNLLPNYSTSLPMFNNLTLRLATEKDVSPTTKLIHEAFAIWKSSGLKLSPMVQSEEKTATHLLDKGFVVLNEADEVVATFSLESGNIRTEQNNFVLTEGEAAPIPFLASQSTNKNVIRNRYLIFKKLAVSTKYAQSGLGRSLYDFAEHLGQVGSFDGMALETVKNAEWLYEWYLRLGFTVIGNYTYPNSYVETVLMIKNFDGVK